MPATLTNKQGGGGMEEREGASATFTEIKHFLISPRVQQAR